MQTDRLFEVLSELHPVREEFKSALEKELTILSLPKNYHLLEAPRISGHAFFLNTGSAMTYIFNEGEKQIESFWQKDSIIISVKSFFNQVPSLEYIQLMEPAEVIHISYEGLLMLAETFSEPANLYRAIMNQHHELIRNRLLEFRSLSSYERYQQIKNNFHRIEQITTQEHIASYLGITPQSLSRLKRQNNED